MRLKIVALIIGIAVVAGVGLSLLRTRPGETSTAASSDGDQQPGTSHVDHTTRIEGTRSNTAASAIAPASDSIAGIQNSNSNIGKPIAKFSGPASGQAREEYIEQRVGELMDLGMTDDPEALKTLLSEINNPEGEIRKAAIEAVKQFGSTDAISKLEEALAGPDTHDKQDIREAIEFLKLPSFVSKRS